jgi:hypothetical protein
VEIVSLVPPTMATRAWVSSSSVASIVGLHGITLVSNLRHQPGAGGGDGDREGNVWCDGEPSEVGVPVWPDDVVEHVEVRGEDFLWVVGLASPMLPALGFRITTVVAWCCREGGGGEGSR